MDVTEMTSTLVIVNFLFVAVIQDLRSLKVSNRLILIGMCVAVPIQIWESGVGQIVWILPNIIIPVIVLYLFYLSRILGAADIKLFSMVGCYLNLRELIYSIIAAFIVGAILALFKMIICGNFISRISAGACYIKELAVGNVRAYEECDDSSLIHFSIAILFGVLLVKVYLSIT